MNSKVEWNTAVIYIYINNINVTDISVSLKNLLDKNLANFKMTETLQATYEG